LIVEEEDPVPLYFLDESHAGIETSSVSSSLNSHPQSSPHYSSPRSAMRKSTTSLSPSPSPSTSPSSSSPTKPRKLVRFLDRVEVVSAPANFYLQPADFPASKKVKLSVDDSIAAGLGRAGSPNRSPNSSSVYLSPPATPSPPRSPLQSWRVPTGASQSPVRVPPRVRSPSHEGEEVDLMAHEIAPRPGVEYVRGIATAPVVARKMWKHGEVRFEDQWGRRLIPVGRREGFRFDLWPVEEDVLLEGPEGEAQGGAWVRGRGEGGR
jgi:hypothetical protein